MATITLTITVSDTPQGGVAVQFCAAPAIAAGIESQAQASVLDILDYIDQMSKVWSPPMTAMDGVDIDAVHKTRDKPRALSPIGLDLAA
jgi:hypothetical protein